jgi:hypothetical protein
MPFALFSCLALMLCFVGQAHADLFDLDEATDSENLAYRSLPFIRVSGDYGLSLHIGGADTGTTQDGDTFLRNTRLGGAMYADISVFPWPRGGFGLFYSRYTSNDHADGIRLFKGDLQAGNYRDKTQFDFYGPIFMSRLRMGPSVVLGGLGAGPLVWKTVRGYNNQSWELTSNTYGILCQVGIDLPLMRSVAIGIQGRLILAATNQYKVDGVTVHLGFDPEKKITYYNSLNRLEVTAGLRFGI